jgi:hypothetical protein
MPDPTMAELERRYDGPIPAAELAAYASDNPRRSAWNNARARCERMARDPIFRLETEIAGAELTILAKESALQSWRTQREVAERTIASHIRAIEDLRMRLEHKRIALAKLRNDARDGAA